LYAAELAADMKKHLAGVPRHRDMTTETKIKSETINNYVIKNIIINQV